MSEISRTTIFRSKIKKEAEKEAAKKSKNKVCVIFQSPEEEKKFSEIAQKLNYGKFEDEKDIER